MSTYTALTTLDGEAAARALGEALERMDPEPYGVGVFEIEDGSDRWEVGVSVSYTHLTLPTSDLV